ncbi:hypothetical protein SAMN02745148_01397 [Modicisalibacter ilicicola DSM 19980]|uniref:Uncharacterized protein n=1 Tax=Modicisalibacter ilicicola DSM 19980 TaxID=1121942 RepID=A0A1M4XBL1_9GAMM|nr:hypothetical protein [Halomonas ilicicola]SHE90686.1 hypothetical protein SAMN02745148_01397 [Halomonas ilicicola DSM 19980]
MSDRYAVVKEFDHDDEVIGWKVVDTEKDNWVMATHASEGDARREASELERRHAAS